MRLFRVEQAWDGLDSWALREEQCVFVDLEEPVLHIGEHALPISTGLVEDLTKKGGGRQPILAAKLTPATPPIEEVEGEPLPRRPLSAPPSPERKLTRPTGAELTRIRERAYWGEALIHVCVPPYPGGRVRFRSTMFVEKVVEGRFCSHIEREYLWLDEGEGLEVVAMRKDEQEALIKFLPNAALRVEHEDEFVPPGESPVLVLTWTGKVLRVFRPQRFQRTPLKTYRR